MHHHPRAQPVLAAHRSRWGSKCADWNRIAHFFVRLRDQSCPSIYGCASPELRAVLCQGRKGNRHSIGPPPPPQVRRGAADRRPQVPDNLPICAARRHAAPSTSALDAAKRVWRPSTKEVTEPKNREAKKPKTQAGLQKESKRQAIDDHGGQ